MELGIYEMTELPIVSSRNCIAVGEWVVFSDPRLENAYTHSRVQVVGPTLNANHFQWMNEKNPWFWNFLLQVKSVEIFLARVVSPWDGFHMIGYKLLKWGWPLIIILRSMEKKWTAENDWMVMLRLEKIYETKPPLLRGRKTWGAVSYSNHDSLRKFSSVHPVQLWLEESIPTYSSIVSVRFLDKDNLWQAITKS